MTDERATQSGSSELPQSNSEAANSSQRKPYDVPQLVEYGDIATLTQTGGVSQADGKAPRKLSA